MVKQRKLGLFLKTQNYEAHLNFKNAGVASQKIIYPQSIILLYDDLPFILL